MSHSKKAIFWLYIFTVLTACKDSEVKPQITPVVLTNYELLATRSQSEILSFIKTSGLPLPNSEIKHGVDIYKVTYLTTFKTSPITASGLVLLPQSNEGVGMLSFQHGTIVAHSEAPTATLSTSSMLTFYSALATTGLIGVIPDFIGFGSSKDVTHPYYLEKPTAAAVIDNLKAARELALIKGLNFNQRLLLAGYSQGGYATMAAHKAIEENGLENFNLIASFPASGGYDIKGVQEFFFKQETYDQPFYLAYVAFAYKNTLGWTQSLADFFQEPYAGKIPVLLSGAMNGGEVNSELTQKISDLLNPEIRASIDTSPNFQYIVEAFRDNSLTDWKPKIKMYMYHGDLDTTVPYENSVSVHQQFLANGASPQIVTFTSLPFATHSSGVSPYLIDLISKVLLLK